MEYCFILKTSDLLNYHLVNQVSPGYYVPWNPHVCNKLAFVVTLLANEKGRFDRSKESGLHLFNMTMTYWYLDSKSAAYPLRRGAEAWIPYMPHAPQEIMLPPVETAKKHRGYRSSVI